MTLLRDLSVLWSLFHILVLFMLLYRSRYPQKKTFLLTTVTMGPLIFLNVAGVALFGAALMGKIFILTCTLPSLLFFWFVSKDKKGRFFFTFGLADTVALWIIAVTNIVDFYFGGQQYILMLAGRLVLFPLAEWVAVHYLRKPYMELQDAVANGWGIFAGMTGIYYILLAVSANYPVVVTSRPQELPVFLLILALMPMNYATVFIAMYRQLLLYRKQQGERLLQEQKNTLEAQLENQQRIRKMKHDMKGHTVLLSGLLTAGKIKEAMEYLKGVEDEMDALPQQFCANPYLNAVFAHYFRKLEELGAETYYLQPGYTDRGRGTALYGVVPDTLQRTGECLRRLKGTYRGEAGDIRADEIQQKASHHTDTESVPGRSACGEGRDTRHQQGRA